MIAYGLQGELDQTWNTNMDVAKDMGGLGVGAVAWKLGALVAEEKRVGVEANTG